MGWEMNNRAGRDQPVFRWVSASCGLEGERCGVDGTLFGVGELSVGTTSCRICSQSWTSCFNLEAGAREAQARLGVKDGGPWRGGTNGDFQAHPGDSYTPPVVRKVEIFIIFSGGS